MKQIFFTFSLIVLLLGVNKTYAQSGSFSISTHNVAYALTPATFADTLNVVLNIDSTTVTNGGTVIQLNLAVLDASNSVLMSWSPSPANNYYYHYFDISALSAGSYHVNVLDSSMSILQTILFTK